MLPGASPEGFKIIEGLPLPAFAAPFDLLTTADDDFKTRIRGLPGHGWWSRWLTLRAAFIGTTVSEYALLPAAADPDALARTLRQGPGRQYALTIFKDLPLRSPLLSEADNALADQVVQACTEQGFVVLDGQALAYVPIDFADGDAYLDRLPKDARRYLKRKLRSREQIAVRRVPTGEAYADDARVDAYYALYEQVYAQSEIHFDRLTRPYFAARAAARRRQRRHRVRIPACRDRPDAGLEPLLRRRRTADRQVHRSRIRPHAR